MKYRLTQNVGVADADRFCIPADSRSIGDVVELSEDDAALMKKDYPALLEVIEPVQGLAKPAALHGTPEKATEDLKRYKEKGTVKSDE